MFVYIAILLFILGALSGILALYCLYCAIGTHRFNKKIKKNGKSELEKKSHLNIAVWIIRKALKIKKVTGSALKSLSKKLSALAITVCLSVASTCGYAAFFCISVGIVAYTIDLQVTAFTTAIQTLFSSDDDCQCYALCTGDAEDDKKCTYELLFGPTEYEKLVDDMEKLLTYSDIEYFDTLNQSDDTTGKEKNDFIKARINENMVNDYKAIVGSNKKFRSDDGKDRSAMSFDELQTDLYNLLSDYKVNGRNPNCDCATCAEIQLSYKCMGEEHYKEGWTWDAIWSTDTSTSTSTGEANTPGTATGQYAITLDDGNYYWYHQSSELCDYNAQLESFGYVGSCRAGGASNGTMAKRGCGIYSTAIALSNLLGEEITPWVVINNVLGCDINVDSNSGAVYFESTLSNGISYNGSLVSMDMDKLAEKINQAYGSKGIVAQVVNFDQSTVDSYMYDDSNYTYAITSYRASSGFTWYTGDGHFMVLRPGSGAGKYKCFTSAYTQYGRDHQSIVDGMNDELDWATIKSAEKHGNCIIISRAKSYYNTGSGSGSGGTVGYNKEVYDILVANSSYSAKANALATCYAIFEPKYGKNAAIGIMANIYHEGNYGRVEDAFAKYGYFGFSLPSGSKSIVQSKEDAEYLANWTTVKEKQVINGSTYDKGSCGLGMIQWSAGRRVALATSYLSSCTSYSQDELAAVEMAYMASELDGSYSPVVTSMQGKSASECASIICESYEKPANLSSEKVSRASTATELSSLLSGVTTSGVTSGSTSGTTSNSGTGVNTTVSNDGNGVATYAQQFVGGHYKWGDTNVTVTGWQDNETCKISNKKTCPLAGADCSGFILTVYQHFGVTLPHSSSALRSVGTAVDYSSESNLKPGDIICYDGHVAIYIGNGQIVHSSSHSTGIKISDKWNFKDVLAVRRVI